MTTVVDQVITVFDAVWKGEGAAKSAALSLQQYQKAGGMAAMKHQLLATTANATRSSMMNLSSTIGEGGHTVETAAAEFERMGGKLAETEAEMERLIPTTQTAGEKFKSFAASAGMVVAALGAAAIAFKATYAAAKKFYDLSQEGAQLTQLRDSFDLLNASVMKTPSLLGDMVSATNDTMTEADAMQSILTLVAGSSEKLTQEFARAAPKLAEIAKAANKLNPTLGDTNFMFQSIARGVKRLEPRLLDNLGLNVRMASANERWSETMGISVEAMTAENKVQAALNETLRVGKNLIDQVGGSTESAVDGYLQLEAATENYKNAYKESLAAMMIGQSTIAQNIQLAADETRAMTVVTAAVDKGIASWNEWGKWSAAVTAGTMSWADVIQLVTMRQANLVEAGQKVNAYAQEYLFWQYAMAGRVDEWEEIYPVERVSSMGDAAQKTAGEMLLLKEAMLGLDQGGSVVTPGKAFQEGQEARGKVIADLAKDSVKEIDALIKVIRDADSATGDYAMAALDAKDGTGFFNEEIKNIGMSWQRTGGTTKEAREEVERLEKKLESAKTKLSDTEMGLGQFGREEDAIAKSTGKLAADIAILEGAIAGLTGEQGELIQVNTKATWNQENINKAIGEAGDDAGASSKELIKYKIHIGELTQEQGLAALKAAEMADAVVQAGIKIDQGMDPTNVEAYIERVKTALDTKGLQDYLPDRQPFVRDLFGGEFGDEFGSAKFNIPIDTSEDPDTLIEQLETIKEGAEGIIDLTDADGADLSVLQKELDILLGTLLAISGTYTATVKVEKEARYSFPGSNDDFGGPIQQNQARLVGGKGPEVFVPNVNGRIVPNNEVGEGMPERGSIHLAVNIHGDIIRDDLDMTIDNALSRAAAQLGVV